MARSRQAAEDNANLVLWSVHILGPDEIWPAPSHFDAVYRAAEFNAGTFARDRIPSGLFYAYAAPWPFSGALHAERLAQWIAEAKREGRIG